MIRHNDPVMRICIVGAGVTGKTTLAMVLAEHYQAEWLPDYLQEYWLDKMERGEEDAWTSEEFFHIAQEQARREDEATGPILICDGNPFSTCIWHEHHLGVRYAPLEALAASRHYDLYILTDVLNDEVCRETHTRFLEELTASRKLFIAVRGSEGERVRQAIEAVDREVKGYP
ncbi:MAG TPA: ATP-binding protein [Fimbriimonadaceae bacterium]|nr:ATP-binding protein [Fimbriimonadaceae bacterium]